MQPPRIEDLFYNDRCRDSGILLLFYAPVGLLLALMRVFIGLHAFLIACILPKTTYLRRVVLRTMCTWLGVVVKVDNMHYLDSKVKVIVANYTSTLDHLAIDLVMPSVLPSVWDLPTILMWILGYTDMGAKKGRNILIRNAKRHVERSSLPLLSFPEGASTNGQVGLLKFSVWPFSLDQPVQPIVVEISRPLFSNISPSILGGRWWIDLFWFLFVPCTHFRIRVLPPMSAGEDDGEQFSERVQKRLACELGIAATTYTSADKVEYAKKRIFFPGQKTEQTAAPSSELEVMVRNVREVLPHVPVDVIRKDLELTKDVDLTITNILEGVTEMKEPERTPPVSQPASSLLTTSANASCIIRAKTVKQNSQQRQLSLAERKQQMIQAARERYLEKHGNA